VHVPFIAQNFVSTPPGPWVTLLADDFESNTGVWQFVDRNGPTGGDYSPARRACFPYAGAYSAWLVGGGADGAALSCGDNYPPDADARMIYGPFSLVGATAAQLTFQANITTPDPNDRLFYGASSDGNAYQGFQVSFPATNWTTITLDLAEDLPQSFLGLSEVYVLIAFQSDGSEQAPHGAHVDDVLLRKCIEPVCPP
jgi:hypothetical protein